MERQDREERERGAGCCRKRFKLVLERRFHDSSDGERKDGRSIHGGCAGYRAGGWGLGGRGVRREPPLGWGWAGAGWR